MHNVYIPVIAIVVAFGIIFGGQAISESHVDDDVASLIAEQLSLSQPVELENTVEVEKGYGLCGWYRTKTNADPAPFYYSKVNDRVTLETGDSHYRRLCSHD